MTRRHVRLDSLKLHLREDPARVDELLIGTLVSERLSVGRSVSVFLIRGRFVRVSLELVDSCCGLSVLVNNHFVNRLQHDEFLLSS